MLRIINAIYFFKILKAQYKLTESEFLGHEGPVVFLSLGKLKNKIDVLGYRCM